MVDITVPNQQLVVLVLVLCEHIILLQEVLVQYLPDCVTGCDILLEYMFVPVDDLLTLLLIILQNNFLAVLRALKLPDVDTFLH